MKGKRKYVPVSVLKELENVRQSDGLYRDADCFRRIVEYCQIGREAKKRKIL